MGSGGGIGGGGGGALVGLMVVGGAAMGVGVSVDRVVGAEDERGLMV